MFLSRSSDFGRWDNIDTPKHLWDSCDSDAHIR